MFHYPLTFALLYGSLLPIFTLLYTVTPGGFHESNVGYEANALHTNAQSVVSDISTQVKVNYLDSYGSTAVLGDGFLIAADSVEVWDIGVEDRKTVLALRVKAKKTDDGGQSADKEVWTRFALTPSPYKPESDGWLAFNISDQTEYLHEGLGLTLGDVIRPNKKFRGPTDGPVFTIRTEVGDRLNEYLKAALGDPYYASDSLSRMFYVSAVTMTTTGFGDFVPVSNGARILVATESLLGVLFAGLFLYTLALKVRRQSTDEET